MLTMIQIDFIFLYMIDLYEQILDRSFEVMLKSLRDRSTAEGFSLDEVKGELESFYKYEEQDWSGRGEVLQADIEGSIMAFEVFFSQYEKENEIS